MNITAQAPPAPASSATAPRNEMLTKQELAARLKVTVRTIENWQRKERLPYFKVGTVILFDWDEVVEHLKAHFRVCRARGNGT